MVSFGKLNHNLMYGWKVLRWSHARKSYRGVCIFFFNIAKLHKTLYTGNQKLSWCRLCHHWWHQRLSSWQPLVPPVMTKLASWQLGSQCIGIFEAPSTPCNGTNYCLMVWLYTLRYCYTEMYTVTHFTVCFITLLGLAHCDLVTPYGNIGLGPHWSI